mgnify:CR=1 FL=1
MEKSLGQWLEPMDRLAAVCLAAFHHDPASNAGSQRDAADVLHTLGRAEPDRVRKLANYIRPRQLPDGGWNIYIGGPAELNATVKAWVALRLAGDAADAPHMIRAAERARLLGGLEQTNSFTRFYLALAGVIGWDAVNLFFAPYLVGVSDRDLEQLAQMMIFEFSQQAVARETGCAFFDTYRAMGGEGTMARWHQRENPLVTGDLTHPTPTGADVVSST